MAIVHYPDVTYGQETFYSEGSAPGGLASPLWNLESGIMLHPSLHMQVDQFLTRHSRG